ncbi:ABC transporter ATP-binding protein [Kineococcus sp. TBRC 1896]|uniref:ABC transporter ATP-binding protein n=1 Tax=Kineococcus mangrovi TaxID=1660183 RepID=A0ABV4I079_9ACTN
MITRLLAVLPPQHRRDLRRVITGFAVAAFAQGLAALALLPLLQALVEGDTGAAWWWLAALLLASAVFAAVRARTQAAAFSVGARLSAGVHHELADALLRLPLAFFTPARTGALSQVAGRNVPALMSVPAHLVRPLVDAVVVPATVVLGLLVVQWRLGLVALACGLLVVPVLRWSTRAVERFDAARDGARAEASSRVLEFARLQPVLRSTGRDAHGLGQLDAALVAEHDADRRLLLRGTPALLATAAAVRTALLVLLAVVVLLATGEVVDAVLVPGLLVLVVRALEPLGTVGETGASLRLASNALAGVEEVLAEPALPAPTAPARPSGHRIAFRDVSVQVAGNTVLHEVSATLPHPGLTAVVGPSGAGKSTLVGLVQRALDVTAGGVSIGDVDVRQIPDEDLVDLVSYASQDVHLFAGTLADNVRVGAPDAGTADLDRAAELTGLTELVAGLPQGWDSPVGPGGAQLSGGQRQRVALARTVLKPAPVVVLDEPTSALDGISAAVVRATARELARERSVLLVTHRVGQVAEADHVLVLDGGRLAAAGAPGELAGVPGPYRRLLDADRRSGGWRLGTRTRSAAP